MQVQRPAPMAAAWLEIALRMVLHLRLAACPCRPSSGSVPLLQLLFSIYGAVLLARHIGCLRLN